MALLEDLAVWDLRWELKVFAESDERKHCVKNPIYVYGLAVFYVDY